MRSPSKRALLLRKFKRAGGLCPRCRVPLVLDDPSSPRAATLDHVVPRAAGGTNAARNLRLLCLRCNQAKAATIPAHVLKPDGSIPRRLLKRKGQTPFAMQCEAQRALEALAQHRAERPQVEKEPC